MAIFCGNIEGFYELVNGQLGIAACASKQTNKKKKPSSIKTRYWQDLYSVSYSPLAKTLFSMISGASSSFSVSLFPLDSKTAFMLSMTVLFKIIIKLAKSHLSG